MSAWSNEVKDIILRALPKLSSDVLQQILSKLQSSGLESKEDLQYVQQEDLSDVLPVIQLRKLLQVFKSGNLTKTFKVNEHYLHIKCKCSYRQWRYIFLYVYISIL